MGTGGFYPAVKVSGGVKQTIYLQLVPMMRIRGSVSPLHQQVFIALCLIKTEIRLYDVVVS